MAPTEIVLTSEALRRLLTRVIWWKAAEYVEGLEEDAYTGDRTAVNTKATLLRRALVAVHELTAAPLGEPLRIYFNSVSFGDLVSGARDRMQEIAACMFEHDDLETRNQMYAEHEAAAVFLECYQPAEAVA